MTQHYTTTGTGLVEAWEAEGRGEFVGGAPGYNVKHDDGSIYWMSKERFEAAYLPLGHIGSEPGYLQRMRAEHAQLEHRLAKLRQFISTYRPDDYGFEPEDDVRLSDQEDAMSAYARFLRRRIDRAAARLGAAHAPSEV